MANEPLGLVEERKANRIKYARYAYVAPHDRLAPPPALPVAVAVSNPITVTMDERVRRKAFAVMSKFCEAYNETTESQITVDTLRSPHRSRKIAWSRHVCMILVKNICGLSSTALGKVFDRDHTSCMYGLLHAADHMAAVPALAATYAKVRAHFRTGP